MATSRNAHAVPHGRLDFESETFVINAAESCARKDHARRSEVAGCLDSTGAFADSQGAMTVLAPTPIDMRQASRGEKMTNNRREGSSGGAPGTGIGEPGDPSPTLADSHTPAVATAMAVRRLTPEEAESLQGFPRRYTRIPWRGRPAEDCPDGPRYRAIGNSFAVPVVRWIGRRIDAVQRILDATEGR